jgi:hypothetical protein
MSNSENLNSQALDVDKSNGYAKFNKRNLTGASIIEINFDILRSAPLSNKKVNSSRYWVSLTGHIANHLLNFKKNNHTLFLNEFN